MLITEKTMEFLNAIKELIPDYAKDIRLNLDGTIARSSLQGNDAVGVALAAAFAAKSKKIIDIIKSSNAITPEEIQAVLTASALMGMNNIWYPYVDMAEDAELKTQPAQLRIHHRQMPFLREIALRPAEERRHVFHAVARCRPYRGNH